MKDLKLFASNDFKIVSKKMRFKLKCPLISLDLQLTLKKKKVCKTKSEEKISV